MVISKFLLVICRVSPFFSDFCRVVSGDEMAIPWNPPMCPLQMEPPPEAEGMNRSEIEDDFWKIWEGLPSGKLT